MKKNNSTILGIVCMAMTILMVSCQSKPVELSQYSNQIIGKWKCTYEKQTSTGGTVTENNPNYIVEFISGGKYRETWPAEVGGVVNEATWSIDGSNISLVFDELTYNGKIVKFTEKQLVIDFTVYVEQNGASGHVQVHNEYDIEN